MMELLSKTVKLKINWPMKKLILIISSVLFLFIITCINPGDLFFQKKQSRDFEEIMTRGSLVVATSNNPSDYFLFKGEPLGFQLELLEELGNFLGLKIEAVVCKDPSDMIKMLRSGQCDMIASSLNLSEGITDFNVTSIPILKTDLFLVQRKSQMDTKSIVNKKLIRDIRELEGKNVYVPVMSTQVDVINQINQGLNNHIKIVELSNTSQEKLVEQVSDGSIQYTICNSMLAESYRNHFPALDFNTLVKRAEPISWTFSKSSPLMIDKINKWLYDYKSSTRYALLMDKYFNKQNRLAGSPARYDIYPEKRISEYDGLLKKYSRQINWDWRLLASLICQESRFLPNVRSYRGAYGLMQMMPATREHFGLDSTATPEEQIKAGVKYIKFLDNHFAASIPDQKERINFILAAYNIGPGHIIDAQKLAGKFGKNPCKWFKNVDSCLLSKSDPKQYNDPVVQFGYCSGVETFRFVKEILSRYKKYKNEIVER
jgi:membrane-bound lytic murein transglycosylase F